MPLTLIFSCYAPIGYVYGQLDQQALLSVLATDLQETSEFLSIIPLKYYFRAIFLPISSYLAYYISRKFSLYPWKNKTIVVSSLLIITVLSSPITFFKNFVSSIKDTQVSLQELKKYVDKNSWNQSFSDDLNKDYILIIGESARKDYFHIYGYPIDNTPFLDSIPATVINGMTGAGNYTIGSLRLMLTLADTSSWTPRYDYNIIDLANSAGIETTWISNQGFIGKYDTPVSAIASKADNVIFYNKSSYEKLNLSDFEILKTLKNKLDIPCTKKRLFVLHTIGSHPHIKQRILDMNEKYTVNNKKYEYIADYITSIKKTDIFIQRTYNILKNHQKMSNRAFSIIYFSDHGLCHINKNENIILNNNKTSKYHFDIPLIKIDSSDTEKHIYNSQKSGLNFTRGLATWLGIHNDKIKEYQLFDGISDYEDYGLAKKIKQITTKEDPAIDLSQELSGY